MTKARLKEIQLTHEGYKRTGTDCHQADLYIEVVPELLQEIDRLKGKLARQAEAFRKKREEDEEIHQTIFDEQEEIIQKLRAELNI